MCTAAVSRTSGLLAQSATETVLAVLGGLADKAAGECREEFLALSSLADQSATGYKLVDAESAQRISKLGVGE